MAAPLHREVVFVLELRRLAREVRKRGGHDGEREAGYGDDERDGQGSRCEQAERCDHDHGREEQDSLGQREEADEPQARGIFR